MGMQQLIKFQVGDETFGIGITQIHQILKPQEVFKVPNTPTFIEGMINLRGKVLTVFNLRKRFNMPEKENDENTKIIIITMGEYLLGFTVDSVTEIVKIPDEEFVEAPPSITNLDKRFISGVAKLGEKLILLLNLEKVLTPDEAEQVKEIVKRHGSEVL